MPLECHTTEPRWGRDQNTSPQTSAPPLSIPQSPGGGEIKTNAREVSKGARTYHRAPVGARSKQVNDSSNHQHRHTTEPRWGRDQNSLETSSTSQPTIPQSPGGGEIKTQQNRCLKQLGPYHRAPVGARSKRRVSVASSPSQHTTEPRWGRDQNPIVCRWGDLRPIPQSPGGGEIKTLIEQ